MPASAFPRRLTQNSRAYKWLGRKYHNHELSDRSSATVCLSLITNACIIEGANQRGSGGIGRRASLRSWWPKGRRGSSPFFRRIFFPHQINRDVHRIRRVDARDRLPYTGISLAVNARRTSLLCSWNWNE